MLRLCTVDVNAADPLTFQESRASFSAAAVETWSSWRKKGGLFLRREAEEEGPDLRMVEAGYEVQSGKRSFNVLNRL